MRPIARVSFKPTCVQVSPASVERYTPPPHDELWRLFCSPVPAQRIRVSPGKIASEPKVLSGCLAKMSFQVVPLLLDFQSPPAAVATYNTAGSFGSIWTSCMRPPITAGPTSRAFNASKEERVWADSVEAVRPIRTMLESERTVELLGAGEFFTDANENDNDYDYDYGRQTS